MSESIKDVVHRAIREMDENLEPTSPNWGPAEFLMAAALLKTADFEVIAEAVEMDRAYAAVSAERATKAKIFSDGACDPQRWMGDDGGILFWMDCAVIEGTMETADGKNFSLSASGLRQVKALLEGSDGD